MVREDQIIISRASPHVLDKATLNGLRGSFFKKLDFRFFIIAIISLVIHTFIVSYSLSVKIEKKKAVAIEQLPERFAKLIIDKPLPKKSKKEKTDSKKSLKSEKSKTGETKTPPPPTNNYVHRQSSKAVEAKVAKVEEKVRTVGVLGMLTGVGKTAKGPSVVDVLGTMKDRKAKFDDLDNVLENMSGLKKDVPIDVLDRKLVKSKDIGVTHKEEIDDLIASVGQVKSVDLAKQGNFILQLPEKIEGAASSNEKRDPESINAVVASHKASIKMTYDKFLKRDPELAGKITVKITIAASGSVTTVVILENTTGDKEFEQEIVRKIKLWEFDPITEGDVTVSYPFVFAPAS